MNSDDVLEGTAVLSMTDVTEIVVVTRGGQATFDEEASCAVLLYGSV